MKYFTKVAEKRKDSGIMRGLGFGAMSGLASTVTTHPIEHKLYGQGKGFFKHLGARLGKGLLASAVGYGTYHYLTQNENKIKNWSNRAKRGYKKKYFK